MKIPARFFSNSEGLAFHKARAHGFAGSRGFFSGKGLVLQRVCLYVLIGGGTERIRSLNLIRKICIFEFLKNKLEHNAIARWDLLTWISAFAGTAGEKSGKIYGLVYKALIILQERERGRRYGSDKGWH